MGDIKHRTFQFGHFEAIRQVEQIHMDTRQAAIDVHGYIFSCRPNTWQLFIIAWLAT